MYLRKGVKDRLVGKGVEGSRIERFEGSLEERG